MFLMFYSRDSKSADISQIRVIGVQFYINFKYLRHPFKIWNMKADFLKIFIFLMVKNNARHSLLSSFWYKMSPKVTSALFILSGHLRTRLLDVALSGLWKNMKDESGNIETFLYRNYWLFLCGLPKFRNNFQQLCG